MSHLYKNTQDFTPTSYQKNAIIEELGRQTNGKWEWKLEWKIRWFDWEVHEMAMMMEKLDKA